MSRKLLLVEGRDDGAVAIALWNARGFPRSFEVEVEDEIEGIGGEIAGKDAVLKSLSVYFKNRQVYPVVGVLLDADESLSATWDAVAGRLQGAGYLIPSDLPTAGLVLDHPSGDGPRIGVWLMPDNSLPGMLEDFMRALIPGDDTLAPEVERALQAIEDKRLQRYASRHRPKAFIHTWLAWQKKPGKPMGLSITRGDLDPTAPQADAFVNWLYRLFLEG
jgi:hypothetical protein